MGLIVDAGPSIRHFDRASEIAERYAFVAIDDGRSRAVGHACLGRVGTDSEPAGEMNSRKCWWTLFFRKVRGRDIGWIGRDDSFVISGKMNRWPRGVQHMDGDFVMFVSMSSAIASFDLLVSDLTLESRRWRKDGMGRGGWRYLRRHETGDTHAGTMTIDQSVFGEVRACEEDSWGELADADRSPDWNRAGV